MKLGILGGTFNPPHLGHLEAARHVRDALSLDRILFIPTNIPPHKPLPHRSASAQQRLEMTRRMVSDEEWAAVSDLELRRGGASYTVDTLRALEGCGPLSLIVGTDMLLTFEQWREPEAICHLATLAVVARGHGERSVLSAAAARLREQYGADIRLIECPVLPLSSTALRSGEAADGLHPAVAAYIRANRLYL